MPRGRGRKSRFAPDQRFGLLRTVRRGEDILAPSGASATWECVCDCGKVCVIRARCLATGNTKSCGCRRGYRKSSPDAPFREVVYFYRRNAQLRKLEFSLSDDQFKEMILKNCYWCDSEPSIFRKTGFAELIHGGVDRLNPMEGYTPTNCVPCCQICNWMKSNMTAEGFMDQISKIASRHGIAKLMTNWNQTG
jgi:hypothetical protein